MSPGAGDEAADTDINVFGALVIFLHDFSNYSLKKKATKEFIVR